MAFPTLWQTAKSELFSLRSLLVVLAISLLYFAFSTLILNYKLVYQTVAGNYPASYKLTLLFNLLQGARTAFSAVDLLLLVLTAVLVGLNILLIAKTIARIESGKGKLSLSVGGSAILGIVVAGCSSCGFSVLSLLGLSASLSFIPFGGIGLHLLVLFLLLFSFIYALRTLHYKIACKV